jgi:Skp family chaperone for outer membrane proteins
MKNVAQTLVIFACLTSFGCDQSTQSSNGPVAVVDLDAIAQKIGKDKQILEMIEQRQVSLNDQVVATQNSLVQQLNQKKSEFGEIGDEEAKQLLQLQNRANSILATTRTQAQTNLTSFQQEVIDRFRNEIKPIAMELANQKGCRVVLSKNDSVVFAFDKTVDLTDEVAAKMQSTAAPATASRSAIKATESSVKQAAAQTNPKK